MTTEQQTRRSYKDPSRRCVVVSVSLQPDQKAFLTRRAEAEGVPVSEVVRAAVDRLAAEERG